MSYGETLYKLNPCISSLIGQALTKHLNGSDQIRRLLDVGCGRGATLAYLLQYESYELYGVEPDPTYVKLARSACPAAINIVQAAAESLPFTEAFFDGILMECVFSLLDGHRALSELARVIKPGGILLVSDVYTRCNKDWIIEDSKLFRHFYSRQTIEALFSVIGFKVAEFDDRMGDMLSMLAQMILDGVDCGCSSDKSQKQLKEIKASYGLWVFKKQDIGKTI